MTKLNKVFLITGITFLSIGIILELIYWIYLKNIIWPEIYPPPPMKILVDLVPYLGILFIAIGAGCLLVGIWLHLKEDLVKI